MFPTDKPCLLDIIVDATSLESVAAAAIAIVWPAQGFVSSVGAVDAVRGYKRKYDTTIIFVFSVRFYLGLGNSCGNVGFW